MCVLLSYTSKSANKQFLVHFEELVFDFHFFELGQSLLENSLAVIRDIQVVAVVLGQEGGPWKKTHDYSTGTTYLTV